MPDPPLNVQSEPGPNTATVLVSWLPVTITSSGQSNGVKVTGYQVMADGRRCKSVVGPTGEILSDWSIDQLTEQRPSFGCC